MERKRKFTMQSDWVTREAEFQNSDVSIEQILQEVHGCLVSETFTSEGVIDGMMRYALDHMNTQQKKDLLEELQEYDCE